jgi:thiol-disulfide isomerase/thioredoxin
MPSGLPEDHVLADDPWWDPPEGRRNGRTSARRRRAAVPAVALFALAAVATLFIVQSQPSGGPSAGSYISTPGLLTTVAPAQRIAGPRLRGQLLDGTRFDSATWAGHIIVVNFWGSWCPPCRAETPELVRVANATRSTGVEFLGVDVRDNRASARAFVRQYQVPYPSIFDSDNQALLAFRGLPANAVPTTFVLDTRGRIAARALGRINAAQLSAVLATLQGESPSARP